MTWYKFIKSHEFEPRVFKSKFMQFLIGNIECKICGVRDVFHKYKEEKPKE